MSKDYKDLQNFDISTVPQFPSGSMKYLYHHDYYDGPIDGVAEINKEPYYYFCHGWEGDLPFRRFLLFKLTTEEFELLNKQHGEFEEWKEKYKSVGYATEQSREDHKVFKAYLDQRHFLTKERVVGWIDG